MKPRHSFSARHTRNIDKIRKQRGKYPTLLKRIISTSDIILEILDARFQEETRNKEIEEIIKSQNKALIYVLNKSDLTEIKTTNLKPAIFVSATTRMGGKNLRDRIKLEARKVKKSEDNKYDRIQVGVIGYPNTGKSSIINLLIGKSSAKTGAEAGFTKGIQKLRLTADILLLDSPGVIPESKYSSIDKIAIAQDVKLNARDCNKIKEPEIAVNEIFKEYPKQLEKFYKITAEDSEEFLEKLGKQKGFMKKGNEVNTDKIARQILKDWQSGKIKI